MFTSTSLNAAIVAARAVRNERGRRARGHVVVHCDLARAHAGASTRREFTIGIASALTVFASDRKARAAQETIVNPQPLDGGWARFYG